MARFSTVEVNTAGLYRWLEQRERAGCAEWEPGQQSRMAKGYAARAYPRRRRLDAFAAGAPVNVDPGEIWGWSTVHSEGALIVQRPVGRGARVIVGSDDTVTWSDDDWAGLWLEENDL
jgi:hypothetical protein